MAYDLIVIGCGLSGLYAGALAARRGKKVLLLARGVGSTHIGAGTIDVVNGDKPTLSLLTRSKSHPYSIIGAQTLKDAVDQFKTICAEHSYPLHGEVGKNFKLPTAVGSTRHACLIPETMLAGNLSRKEDLALANIHGFRDFNAHLAISTLRVQSLIPNLQVIDLHLPSAPFHRDSYATDLAHLFDKPDYRAEVIALWKPWLKDSPKRIGIPAILGLDHSLEAKGHLESELGIELFEIPILPPSVPGMRLFNLLRDDFQNHGGRFIMGPTVTGEIEGGRVVSASADMNGHIKEYRAENYVLASGGFLNGGIIGEMDGTVRESIFNLPIASDRPEGFRKPFGSRGEWTNEVFLASHPYAKFGLSVDKNLRPIDANGKVIAENLFAVGSVLAGADRVNEGSREGIELGTAWKVISG
ncbi:MAG: anaerobic glycerol-3-phosphate dehydrogenase subunit GlpB [Chloroflexota bacterium]